MPRFHSRGIFFFFIVVSPPGLNRIQRFLLSAVNAWLLSPEFFGWRVFAQRMQSASFLFR
jgi:hypothetical protein